jgi:hypothetical protein
MRVHAFGCVVNPHPRPSAFTNLTISTQPNPQAFFESRLPGTLSFPDAPDAPSLYVAITTWLCGSITTFSALNSGK